MHTRRCSFFLNACYMARRFWKRRSGISQIRAEITTIVAADYMSCDEHRHSAVSLEMDPGVASAMEHSGKPAYARKSLQCLPAARWSAYGAPTFLIDVRHDKARNPTCRSYDRARRLNVTNRDVG